MNNIKTHFVYTQGEEIYQVALGFLPYVPRAGEALLLIGRDRKTNLWSIHLPFKVEKVTYEMFGDFLPVSLTWENDSKGGGCQVNLYVTPDSEEAQKYVEEIIEVEEDRRHEREGE